MKQSPRPRNHIAMERYKNVDNLESSYSPDERRQASALMKSAQYETEMKLPPIRVTNQSTIRSMADSMLGHRQDENCNLNRTALMIEKANRLGEGAKQATSPTNG